MSGSDEPIAYFLTWVTYGTWLPGNKRGWVEYKRGWQLPSPSLELECELRMIEDAVRLNRRQRDAVERQIRETCFYKGWNLHAVNCRSNHIHAVVSGQATSKKIRMTLKAYATRCLKALACMLMQSRSDETTEFTNNLENSRHRGESNERLEETNREHWWAERGSIRWIFSDESLFRVIQYVTDGQESSPTRSSNPR